MPARAERRILARMLGSLALIAHYLRRLRVQETIDHHCPSRGNAHLTHGQVAVAIIANRLSQPGALYRLIHWAREFALDELWQIDPERLNDDRLGRCVDALAEHIPEIQGEVALAAVREFNLQLDQLHGDVTSVVLQGAYPEEAAANEPGEGERSVPRPAFGYGGEPDCKQLRVVEITSLEGLVPIWHRTYDGNKPDVGMVIAEMEALQKHVPLGNCLVVGDSKLLTQALLPRLRRNGWSFLAPLPHNPALDDQCLALPEAGWELLDYAPASKAHLPPQERSEYRGQSVLETWTDPETGETACFRKVFIRSSALAAQQRRLRDRRVLAAATELNELIAKLPRGGRGKSAAWLEARALVLLDRHKVRPYFQLRVTGGKPFPMLEWEENTEALRREAALDGYYVLYTDLSPETVSDTEVLRRWKPQIATERRFSDWKGPLRVHPVFLNTPARIAALILLLHLALMIYCLIECEARRRLAAQGKTKFPRLLAGQIDAVPTGENILRLFQNVLLVIEEGQHGRNCWVNLFTPEQEQLWRFLEIETPGWALIR
jgi:transposase